MDKVFRVAFWAIVIFMMVFVALRYATGNIPFTILIGTIFMAVGKKIDSKIFRENL